MKHILLSLLIVATAGLFILTGCAPKEETGSAAFTLKVGLDASFPPYGFKDNDGKLVGFDLDLAAEVAKRRGWNLELKAIDWDAKDAELGSGTINCIWNGFTINGREGKYAWSVPYVDNRQVVIVRNNSGIKALADLKGKVVSAQADSSGLAALKDKQYDELRAGLKKLLEVPDFNQAFMELQSGSCDAVVVDEGVAMTHIKKHQAAFSMLQECLKSEQYGVGFKLGDEALRDQVQETLIEMVKDGTFKKISEKWFDGRDVCAIKVQP